MNAFNDILDFDLDIGDIEDINTGINTRSFKEFCEAIDVLRDLDTPDDFFDEKVTDDSTSIRKSLGKAAQNTYTTTKAAGKIYSNITTGGGNLISATWDLFMKGLTAVSKIFVFATNKLSNIPKSISQMSSKIAAIPTDIRNKIRGNIKLYVRIEDISTIYRSNIFKTMDLFFSKANLLASGDTWTTFFSRRSNKKRSYDVAVLDDNGNPVKDANGKQETVAVKGKANDIKICAELKALAGKLHTIDMTPTTIEMSDAETVAKYFGGEGAEPIKFVDLHGKHRECSTYLDALQVLVIDLNALVTKTNALQDAIAAKYDRTTINASIGKLNQTQQTIITGSMESIQTASRILGEFVKYIVSDMNTIKSSLLAILNSKDGIAGRRAQDGDTELKDKLQADLDSRKKHREVEAQHRDQLKDIRAKNRKSAKDNRKQVSSIMKNRESFD